MSVLASSGSTRTRSVRSLLGPGLLNAWLKLCSTGVAVVTSGRRRSNRSVVGLIVGFEVSISVVSAWKVDGSCANVALPWRSVTGSSLMPCASCCCSEPIARKVVFWFSIRSASDSLRAPIVVTALAVSTRKAVNVFWSRESSDRKCPVELKNDGNSSVVSPSCRLAPAYCSADPWMKPCRPLRVFGSSVLNSASRSVTSRVALAGIVAPDAYAGLLLGPSDSAT